MVVLPASDAFRDRELIHIPYWRFRGLVFALDVSDVTHRILESTAPALPASGIPPSLGLRPQTMAATFYGPQMPGTFLPASIARDDFLKSLGLGLRGRIQGLPSKITYHAFIGESLSLVYAPFFQKDAVLHDGITGRPWAPCRKRCLWKARRQDRTIG